MEIRPQEHTDKNHQSEKGDEANEFEDIGLLDLATANDYVLSIPFMQDPVAIIARGFLARFLIAFARSFFALGLVAPERHPIALAGSFLAGGFFVDGLLVGSLLLLSRVERISHLCEPYRIRL